MNQGDRVTVIIFYKNWRRERVPILISETFDSYLSDVLSDEFIKKVQSDFPKAKRNLFALIKNHEFRLA